MLSPELNMNGGRAVGVRMMRPWVGRMLPHGTTLKVMIYSLDR